MNARSVYVIAELDEQNLTDSTLEVVGEGRTLADQLGCPLCLVLLGNELGRYMAAASRQDADRVVLIEHPLLAEYSTDGFVAALAQLYGGQSPLLTLLSATVNGQDLAPRLAARLHLPVVTDCLWVRIAAQDAITCIKPTHRDQVHSTLSCPPGQPLIVTMRAGAIGFTPPPACRVAELVHYQPELREGMIRTSRAGYVHGDPHTMALNEAEIIIAGGRGVKRREDWQLIEQLAEVMGAAVGGTRLALDLGFISRQRMIGQTGAWIKPRLYLAAGISGTLHHTGGVAAARIIAVNNDPNAPIFKLCNLGIVGDLYEILPGLAEKLAQEKVKDAPGSKQAGAL